MFVRCLVIFLVMMHSGRAMSVRGEIVELGGSLMRVVWHSVSFHTISLFRRTTGTVFSRISMDEALLDFFFASESMMASRPT